MKSIKKKKIAAVDQSYMPETATLAITENDFSDDYDKS